MRIPKTKSDLLYTGLAITLLVDVANGEIIRNFNISISPIYKTALLLACAIYLRAYIKLLIPICLFASCIFVHGVNDSAIEDIIDTAQWAAKCISIYLFYLFMAADMKVGRTDRVNFVAKTSFLIIALNLTLGAMGFGHAQYSTETYTLGTRGYIYAGNELAIALTACSAILMMDALIYRKFVNYISIFLVSITLASLTTMKTSMLSVGIVFISLPFSTGTIKLSVSRFAALLSVILIAAGAIFATISYLSNFTEFYSRAVYFIERNGPLTYIFSYRNIWASEALAIMTDYSPLEIIFGSGLTWTTKMEHGGIVEIDPIDTLMTFGLIGLTAIFGFLFRAIGAAPLRDPNPRNISGLLLTTLLIAISFAAGHVVFSGIAAPLIAATLSQLRFKSSKLITPGGKLDKIK